MAKHSMYDETPRREHDGEGNVKVVRPAKKESSSDNTGEPDSAGLAELLKQHEDMKKMHDKHQAESLERIKRFSGGNDANIDTDSR